MASPETLPATSAMTAAVRRNAELAEESRQLVERSQQLTSEVGVLSLLAFMIARRSVQTET